MIVKINPGHVAQICDSVRDAFTQDHHKVNNDLPDTFPGLAEFFYGQIMSMEAQQKVLDLFPEGMKPETTTAVTLQIDNHNTDKRWVWTTSVRLPIRQALFFGKTVSVENLPGIKELSIHRKLVRVVLAEDTTALPPDIRDFSIKVASIAEAHRAIEVRINTEVENMRRFLKEHKTLQSAIAAMPALKFYINWFIQQELDAPEPPKKPRVSRKRAEKQPYDISGLVVKSAAARLNL